jgi:Mg-chelatase subunit ChlD
MRRALATNESFGDISPEVGQLDEAAISDALADDPDELLSLMAEMTSATDVALRAQARMIASRLFLDLARDKAPDRSGIGRVVTSRFRDGGGDIDIDASLDELVMARGSGRAVQVEELRVRTWAKPSTAWCLLVDRSGSMEGRPLATSALAAAAVAVRAEDEFAVLSFGKDVVAPKAMWERRSAEEVVDRVLSLRGHGTTDVAGALMAAGEQLRSASAARRVVVLLSDCRATEPGDVVGAAKALDELVILAPEDDSVEACELAEQAGARWTTVAGPSSVPAAFDRVLGR